MFIFPPDGELHSVTQANFNAFPVSLSEQKLNQVCTLLELPDFRKLTARKEIFSFDSQNIFEFRKYIEHISYRLISDTESRLSLQFLREIEDEIANRLISMLAEFSQAAHKKRVRKRDRAIITAETYIRENSSKSLTVPELCHVANASQRMLEYAFRERYAMTPQAYIKTIRLNNARKQLLKAMPCTNQVTRIAEQNGFSHMGQFSIDYKKLFLECPSNTLKKY